MIKFFIITAVVGYPVAYMHQLYQGDLEDLLDDSVFWGRLLPVNVLYFIIGNIWCMVPWEVVEKWLGDWFLYDKGIYVLLTGFFHWPLLQQIVLYVNLSIFKRLFGRNPYDVFLGSIRLLWPDGIFNVINQMLSFTLPFIIITITRVWGGYITIYVMD